MAMKAMKAAKPQNKDDQKAMKAAKPQNKDDQKAMKKPLKAKKQPTKTTKLKEADGATDAEIQEAADGAAIDPDSGYPKLKGRASEIKQLSKALLECWEHYRQKDQGHESFVFWLPVRCPRRPRLVFQTLETAKCWWPISLQLL